MRLRARVALAVAVVVALLGVGAVAGACAWKRALGSALPPGARADRIVIEKSRRRLTLYLDDAPVKTYRVALGKDPIGPKQFEGDGRTPEGLYRIDFRVPASSCHRALHVSYPSRADVAFASAQGKSAGGDIEIHGIKNGRGWLGPLHRAVDWTNGCVAVTNREIEEIWRAVPDGTPVDIRP